MIITNKEHAGVTLTQIQLRVWIYDISDRIIQRDFNCVGLDHEPSPPVYSGGDAGIYSN